MRDREAMSERDKRVSERADNKIVRARQRVSERGSEKEHEGVRRSTRGAAVERDNLCERGRIE